MSSAFGTPEIVRETLPAVALLERRRRALGEVLVDVVRSPGSGREPVLRLRTYGDGCVAMALGGTFHDRGLSHLRTVIGDLDRHATVELVIDLSQLVRCDRALVRALSGLRVRRLVAGARVELHHSPPELAAELGNLPPATFTVTDEHERGGR